MHQVFTIPELVEVIVEDVGATSSEYQDKIWKEEESVPGGVTSSGLPLGVHRDVMSLGLTASIFREPSLNVIAHPALLITATPFSKRCAESRVQTICKPSFHVFKDPQFVG